MLACGFASHRASCTVAQHSNSTITAAQDWTAWALWVAVASAPLAASGRGCIRARALRLSALLSSDDCGSSVVRRARGQSVIGSVSLGCRGNTVGGLGPWIGARNGFRCCGSAIGPPKYVTGRHRGLVGPAMADLATA